MSTATPITFPLQPTIVIALREECLAIHKMAMELFDSLEDNELTVAGATSVAAMANRAEAVRRDVGLLLAAFPGGIPGGVR
jgi:hypothetical protein